MSFTKTNIFEAVIQQNGTDGQKGPDTSVMIFAQSFGEAESLANLFLESEEMIAPRIIKIERSGIGIVNLEPNT